MKKIMSLMLGMSLVLGAASMFAQDTKKDDTTTTTTKKKKSRTKKAKKGDTMSTTPSTDTKK